MAAMAAATTAATMKAKAASPMMCNHVQEEQSLTVWNDRQITPETIQHQDIVVFIKKTDDAHNKMTSMLIQIRDNNITYYVHIKSL